MAINTKKLLYALAASTVLAGFGSATISTYNGGITANAAKKHHKKKHHQKKHKQKKTTKVKQTVTNQTVTTNQNADGTDNISDYATPGDWFVTNQAKLTSYYSSHDANAYNAGATDAKNLELNPSEYNDLGYKYAYIISLANDATKPFLTDAAGSVAYYNKIYNIYASAGSYINTNHPANHMSLNSSTLQWSEFEN
ncbi:hypothetical protein [Nicoliella lavandulae]|uniref:Uncharacterized protein n=1 Tax=Nicoliella lavandulae TaxID=3082954 RepID=A0ABU8SLW8_9LACO